MKVALRNSAFRLNVPISSPLGVDPLGARGDRVHVADSGLKNALSVEEQKVEQVSRGGLVGHTSRRVGSLVGGSILMA